MGVEYRGMCEQGGGELGCPVFRGPLAWPRVLARSHVGRSEGFGSNGQTSVVDRHTVSVHIICCVLGGILIIVNMGTISRLFCTLLTIIALCFAEPSVFRIQS